MHEVTPDDLKNVVQSECEAPKWTSAMTDPDWTPESPGRGWEKNIASLLGNEAPSLWPSEKNSGDQHEGPSDADIMAFLGLGKDKQLTYGELASPDEHEKVLSYLGISNKSSMLVTLGLNNSANASGADKDSSVTAPQGEFGQRPEKAQVDATKTVKSTLNVSASPFCPAKFRTGSDEGPKLNPAAVPFVPGGLSSNHSLELGDLFSCDPSFKPIPAMGNEELVRAQAAVRHYQNLFIGAKEELQACNKMLLKEKEIVRRSQEALEQRTKELDHVRMELQAETSRSKQASDQLAALQAEMSYYKKLMEQIQGQIQVTWAQFMSQLQQEKVARQASEEAVSQLQAALQLARLEAEQSSLKIAERQSSLKEAQLLAQQQQERADAKEKESNFYRMMYNTAVKQVESSHAAVKASIELEKQARQEAEVRLGQQGQDPLATRIQVGAKAVQPAFEADAVKWTMEASKEQSA